MADSEAQKMLAFQARRLITALFKNYLFLADDLYGKHDLMLSKIEGLLKDEDKNKLDLVDYFDEEQYKSIRKRILDLGNDAAREVENIMEQYEITFKK